MQTFTNNLIFSLNATIPIFLMMALGFFLQRIHLLDDHTTQKLNQFAFKVLLPALLFMDLSTADFQSVCTVLVLYYQCEHWHCLFAVAAASGAGRPWGIYSGSLPQQCCNSRNRLCQEHLWRSNHGSIDDCWNSTAL